MAPTSGGARWSYSKTSENGNKQEKGPRPFLGGRAQFCEPPRKPNPTPHVARAARLPQRGLSLLHQPLQAQAGRAAGPAQRPREHGPCAATTRKAKPSVGGLVVWRGFPVTLYDQGVEFPNHQSKPQLGGASVAVNWVPLPANGDPGNTKDLDST